MNMSIPILLCDENEDFRCLLRDMLIKHGFFHVVEAASHHECQDLLSRQAQQHLIIIQSQLLNDELLPLLQSKQRFIVIARPEEPRTALLAARLGVKHFLNFPFSSRMLFEKIQQINQ
jgi:DNA-binding NtrC family response regulator